jgi:hypothetical protein
MSRFFKALLVTAILVFCSTQLKAQVITAAIHGSVTDSSGAVIQNAQVTVMDTATGIVTRTSTNHRGYYLLPALQIGGPYTVEISAAGFKKFAARGLLLTVNANRDVDASLVVGAATQVIAVQSAEVQVETSNTQLEQVVTQQQIDDLPLLGRDAAGLQKLTPGTVESSDAFGSFATNGSQTQSDSFLLNGVDCESRCNPGREYCYQHDQS